MGNEKNFMGFCIPKVWQILKHFAGTFRQAQTLKLWGVSDILLFYLRTCWISIGNTDKMWHPILRECIFSPNQTLQELLVVVWQPDHTILCCCSFDQKNTNYSSTAMKNNGNFGNWNPVLQCKNSTKSDFFFEKRRFSPQEYKIHVFVNTTRSSTSE